MNDADKELYISRMISGKIRLKLDGKILYISSPRPRDQVEAQVVYSDCIRESSLKDVFTEDEILSEMKSMGLWSEGEESRIEELPKELEDLKVALFKSEGNSKLQKGIRMSIKKVKDELSKLLQKKSEFLQHTCSGFSQVLKSQYLLYSSVIDRDDDFVFDSDNFWNEDFYIIDRMYTQYIQAFISEESMREISRTDPWRSLWNAAKTEGSLFGIPAAHLNKDQKTLVNWSRFYDNIQESPDCPSNEVVEDDDMLDGWIISQSRQREAEKFHRELDSKASKHPGAGEVGVMVDNREYADKVYERNVPMAKQRIRSMQNAVDKADDFREGKSVQEQDLPMVKREIQMQAVRESTGRK